jgi:hypothetical protein
MIERAETIMGNASNGILLALYSVSSQYVPASKSPPNMNNTRWTSFAAKHGDLKKQNAHHNEPFRPEIYRFHQYFRLLQ